MKSKTEEKYKKNLRTTVTTYRIAMRLVTLIKKYDED